MMSRTAHTTTRNVQTSQRPPAPRQPGPDYLGFAVPLRLRSSDGELRLLTTLTHFGTAVDVTIAELRLEAFLPADQATASILTKLAERQR